MPEDYLANLNRYYDEWIAKYDIGKKLVIESDDLDFVANEDHFKVICDRVLDSLDQQDLFLSR
jgi:deoxyadenosine/deoxycytidine kinase